jgi:hypothetical protein
MRGLMEFGLVFSSYLIHKSGAECDNTHNTRQPEWDGWSLWISYQVRRENRT